MPYLAHALPCPYLTTPVPYLAHTYHPRSVRNHALLYAIPCYGQAFPCLCFSMPMAFSAHASLCPYCIPVYAPKITASNCNDPAIHELCFAPHYDATLHPRGSLRGFCLQRLAHLTYRSSRPYPSSPSLTPGCNDASNITPSTLVQFTRIECRVEFRSLADICQDFANLHGSKKLFHLQLQFEHHSLCLILKSDILGWERNTLDPGMAPVFNLQLPEGRGRNDGSPARPSISGSWVLETPHHGRREGGAAPQHTTKTGPVGWSSPLSPIVVAIAIVKLLVVVDVVVVVLAAAAASDFSFFFGPTKKPQLLGRVLVDRTKEL